MGPNAAAAREGGGRRFVDQQYLGVVDDRDEF
jgi:hypothetical protein